MNRNWMLVMSGVLALAACEEKSPSSAGAPAGTGSTGATGALETAKNKISDAASKTGAVLREQRDKLLSSTQTEMDQIKAKVDEWRAKNSGASGDAKTKLDEAAAKVESALQNVKTKYAELKDAAEPTLQRANDELNAAVVKLKEAYQDAKAKFGG